MSFDLSLKLTEFWKTNADIKTVVNFVKANQGSEYRIRKLNGTKEKRFLVFLPCGHHYVLRLTHKNGHYTGHIASDTFNYMTVEEFENLRNKTK